jgi:hypothetical protein
MIYRVRRWRYQTSTASTFLSGGPSMVLEYYVDIIIVQLIDVVGYSTLRTNKLGL